MCTLTQGASICSVDLQQCDSLQFCCYSDPNQVCRYHPMNQARIQNVLFSPLCSFLHVHQTQRSMCISFVFCGEWFFSHQLDILIGLIGKLLKHLHSANGFLNMTNHIAINECVELSREMDMTECSRKISQTTKMWCLVVGQLCDSLWDSNVRVSSTSIIGFKFNS